MKISRAHFMFLDKMTRPLYANDGACRLVMYNYMRNIGRKLLDLNDVNTSEQCNEPS